MSVTINLILSFLVSSDPKKIQYIQETVGETSSQSVVVAVDRFERKQIFPSNFACFVSKKFNFDLLFNFF